LGVEVGLLSVMAHYNGKCGSRTDMMTGPQWVSRVEG
jgi:hypothetical protein